MKLGGRQAAGEVKEGVLNKIKVNLKCYFKKRMLLGILKTFSSICWLFVFLDGELLSNREGAVGGKKERRMGDDYD